VALDTITLTILNSNVPYYAVISLNCDLFSTVDEQTPFNPACSMFCEFYETWCKGLIHLHKYDVARKKAEKYLEMSINQVTSIGCKTSIFLLRKPEDPKKTTDLSQVTDKLYYIMLYTWP
jgi:hypothetical protein